MLVLLAMLAAAGAQPALAQGGAPGGAHLWSKSAGSASADWAHAVAVDGSGNVIATGCFSGTVDFGGGPLTSAGQCDLFVVKYSGTDGTHVWSKRFGNDTASDYGFGVAVSGNGDVVVTGWFGRTVDFGGGPLTSAGFQDIFVVKLLGTTGDHVWSKRFGGAGDDDYGRAVVVDRNNDVVIAGTIRNAAVDFGGGPLTTAGGSDAFVAKFSGTNGAHIWSKRFGGVTNDIGWGVALDSSNNVVATGGFSSTVDFGGGAVNSAGEYDIFAVKLSAGAGALLWVKRLGGTDNDYGHAVAVDRDGNVVLTGTFNGTADFGGGPLTSAGTCLYYYGDIFVIKLDPSGSHLWSERFGNTGCDSGEHLAVDNGGNVFVTGYFQGTVDFGGGPVTSAGTYEIFLVKYASADGSHLWSKGFGSTSDDQGYGVAVDGIGDVFFTGYFNGTVDFGGGPLTSHGSADIVVAKFAGGALVPAVSLIPASLDFGNQLVGTSSAAKTVTLTNGTTAVVSLLVALGGLDSAEFAQTNNCGATLAVGSNCRVDVTFSPTSGGVKAAEIVVTTDAPGQLHLPVPLIGNGTVPAPAVTLAPAALNFGDQLLSTTSAAQLITLTNSGTAPLNIAAIAITGTDSSLFAQTNGCGAALDASASCTISVTFAPTASGAKSAAVMITSDAAGSPHAVALYGTGITPPAVNLSASDVTFSAQIVNTTSAMQTITLTNTGGSVLNIASMSVAGTNAAEFTRTDTCGASLDAGANCTINLTFRPAGAGNCTASLTIQHNAAGGPHTVNLAGLGTDFAVAAQSGSSNSATVAAGQAANYQLSLAGTAGFSGTATLVCSGAPTAATCSVTPASLALNGTTPATAGVTVTTTSRSWLPPLRAPRMPIPLPLLLLMSTVLLLAGWGAVYKRQPRFARALLSTAALAGVLFLAGCGGGGGSSTPPAPRGTPAGSYRITVTASVPQGTQTATRSMDLTLVVQ